MQAVFTSKPVDAVVIQ